NGLARSGMIITKSTSYKTAILLFRKRIILLTMRVLIGTQQMVPLIGRHRNRRTLPAPFRKIIQSITAAKLAAPFVFRACATAPLFRLLMSNLARCTKSTAGCVKREMAEDLSGCAGSMRDNLWKAALPTA